MMLLGLEILVGLIAAREEEKGFARRRSVSEVINERLSHSSVSGWVVVLLEQVDLLRGARDRNGSTTCGWAQAQNFTQISLLNRTRPSPAQLAHCELLG
jgi:hypothetical protein